MAAQIVPFTPDLLPAVAHFSKQVWTRPEDAAYLDWRYLACPSQVGFLAMEGDECTAMIWAFRRPYQIGDRRVTCLDTFDWFALPSRRGSLLGIRLVQALMRQPEPIVAVGGSAETLGLLPRLQWKTVGQVTPFVLPLEGGQIGAYAERRLRVPAALGRAIFRAVARPWFAAGGRAPAPESAQVIAAAAFDAALVALYEGERRYALLPVPDPELMSWLLRGPDRLGTLVMLRFVAGGELRGWSLSRLSTTALGCDATIIDLYAREGDVHTYAWIVAETVAALRAHAPDTIHATASAAPLREALRRARFLARAPLPVRYWPGPADLPPLPLHLGNNTSDTALFPHPTDRPGVA